MSGGISLALPGGVHGVAKSKPLAEMNRQRTTGAVVSPAGRNVTESPQAPERA